MFNLFKKKSTLKPIEPTKKAISLKKEETSIGEQLLNTVVNHDGPVASGVDRYSFKNPSGMEFEIKKYSYGSESCYLVYIDYKSVEELIDTTILHTIYKVLEEKHEAHSDRLRRKALEEAHNRILEFVK